MKVISLIRVSTAAQSLDSQSEKVKNFILKDGYRESDIIPVESIESGSKLSEEERQGLSKMKYHIEHEEIAAVYAYEISRISRKVSIVYSIRDYLIAHNVDLVILNPYFHLLNPDGSMSNNASITFGIFASLAEQETYLRVERCTRGKEKKKAEGKLAQGYPIFGYTVDEDHYIIPHPKQAPIVREIFSRYTNGETSGSIASDLWLRGALCCKTDKLINHQTKVCGILRERRYAFIDGPYRTPLVSKEVWTKAEEIRASRPDFFIRKSRTIECYPLQGYLFNEEGYVLTPSITNNRYVKMNGTTKAISVNMKAADALTMKVMTKYLSTMNHNSEAELDELNKELENTKLKLAGIDAKIDTLMSERDRINRLYIKGRISESESDNMMNSNKNEINALEDIRQDLTYNLSVINNKLILAANPLLLEENPAQIETKEELKEAIHKYIKKIVAVKIGFSRYEMSFQFLDGSIIKGRYFSTNKKLELEIV